MLRLSRSLQAQAWLSEAQKCNKFILRFRVETLGFRVCQTKARFCGRARRPAGFSEGTKPRRVLR